MELRSRGKDRQTLGNPKEQQRREVMGKSGAVLTSAAFPVSATVMRDGGRVYISTIDRAGGKPRGGRKGNPGKHHNHLIDKNVSYPY